MTFPATASSRLLIGTGRTINFNDSVVLDEWRVGLGQFSDLGEGNFRDFGSEAFDQRWDTLACVIL